MRVTDDLADEPGEPAAQARGTRRLAGPAPRRPRTATTPTRSTPPCTTPSAASASRRDYLYDVIDGVETDLEPVAVRHLRRAVPVLLPGGVGGRAGVRAASGGSRPGRRRPATDPAEAAGIAFQLTNILRDLGEDRARGRVYLPADELERFGCPPEAWTTRTARRSAS